MLTDKYEQKAQLKDEELNLRRLELDFQREKYLAEAEERKLKFQLEMEEKRHSLNCYRNVLSVKIISILIFQV